MTTKWTPGRKLKEWMDENRLAGRELWNPNAVARELTRLGTSTDQKTVEHWVKRKGVPTIARARAVADLMSADVLWLLDEEQAWPPPKGKRALEALAKSLPRDEQEAIGGMLSDPVARRMLIAAWNARGDGVEGVGVRETVRARLR